MPICPPGILPLQTAIGAAGFRRRATASSSQLGPPPQLQRLGPIACPRTRQLGVSSSLRLPDATNSPPRRNSASHEENPTRGGRVSCPGGRRESRATSTAATGHAPRRRDLIFGARQMKAADKETKNRSNKRARISTPPRSLHPNAPRDSPKNSGRKEEQGGARRRNEEERGGRRKEEEESGRGPVTRAKASPGRLCLQGPLEEVPEPPAANGRSSQEVIEPWEKETRKKEESPKPRDPKRAKSARKYKINLTSYNKYNINLTSYNKYKFDL
ncbi:serine/arginine repetitive matrix protein 1-like [Penaeus vannamei]|uniref:serine/arginine repetitive matrix protein 1-like n=1 Tax=Penaeus vannamei TaxID=6689 RepID=UPI00387F9885